MGKEYPDEICVVERDLHEIGAQWLIYEPDPKSATDHRLVLVRDSHCEAGDMSALAGLSTALCSDETLVDAG